MTGPSPLPKKKPKPSPIYLEEEKWQELEEISKFHAEVFTHMKEVLKADVASDKVSRNDIIASFIDWAIPAYWNQAGGKPKTKDERAKAVTKLAEQLHKQLSK